MVREAAADDARGIAEVHVRCWQAAYRGILPRQLLDELSADLREDFWKAELADGAKSKHEPSGVTTARMRVPLGAG